MEKAGIIKEIDNLGRIVIPKEIRSLFKLEERVEIVITTEGALIISQILSASLKI